MTAVARSRRTSRLIGLAGACALAVVSLSGCLKLDADLTVNADATASGTLAVEFQKEAAGFLGISDLASFEENFSGEELGAEGLDNFTDCTTSETDAAYVYTCTFENEAFTEGDGPWTITKEGDLVVLRVVNEAQSGDDAALLGDANLGSISVTATFPGPITAVSGDAVEQTSDTSATISGSLTESIDVQRHRRGVGRRVHGVRPARRPGRPGRACPHRHRGRRPADATTQGLRCRRGTGGRRRADARSHGGRDHRGQRPRRRRGCWRVGTDRGRRDRHRDRRRRDRHRGRTDRGRRDRHRDRRRRDRHRGAPTEVVETVTETEVVETVTEAAPTEVVETVTEAAEESPDPEKPSA